MLQGRPSLDPNRVYTLPDLVDIAEQNNPETRVLWERAKQRAAAAGVARSALFPTLAAVASASMNQYSLFFGKFYHEDTALFPAIVNLSYTVFDFGARRARIDEAQANLLAADFSFNDTHRKIIFRVTEAYYRLLDAMSQEGAAQATLRMRKQSRMPWRQGSPTAWQRCRMFWKLVPQPRKRGTSWHPSRGWKRSHEARWQPSWAHLRRVSSASRMFPELRCPAAVEEPIEAVMARAIGQRPDLLAQVASMRSADAEIKRARSAYYPQVNFSGDWGHTNGFGEQKNFRLFRAIGNLSLPGANQDHMECV